MVGISLFEVAGDGEAVMNHRAAVHQNRHAALSGELNERLFGEVPRHGFHRQILMRDREANAPTVWAETDCVILARQFI